ncbi:MAG TPA: 2-oxo acid dehydrogenase subunit E2, partial [Planktothrix sp. UBA8407]|nr:2-oxo acid dehydrogenase subunit E2 [Planktothrix sp. UBA8407]
PPIPAVQRVLGSEPRIYAPRPIKVQPNNANPVSAVVPAVAPPLEVAAEDAVKP